MFDFAWCEKNLCRVVEGLSYLFLRSGDALPGERGRLPLGFGGGILGRFHCFHCKSPEIPGNHPVDLACS